MANEIIKVYDTEVNAIANGTSGRIDPVAAVSGHSGIIANVPAEDIPYYIYKKFYYRIEANEPASEFHIDWDDGEDNSPEKANIEIIKLVTPSHTTITSHIYTEHKHFFPLVRVKSIGGFLSKWYTNDSSLNDYTGLEVEALSAGQNEFSVVSEEKAESDRISTFLPSNLPPIGVLKADKKGIYGGIDNDAILSTNTYPLLYAYSTSTATTKPDVVFTIQDDNGATRKHTLAGTGIWNASSVWRAPIGAENNDTYSNAIPAGNLKTQHTLEVSKILVKSGATATDFTTDGTNYIDIHYDTTGVAPDINENSHTRIYLLGTSGNDIEGDYPGRPSGYSGWKVFLNNSANAGEVLAEIKSAFQANPLEWPLAITATVTDGNGDTYFTFTNILGGNGAKTDISDSVSDSYLITSTPTQGGDAIITDTGKIKKLLKIELDNAKELSDTDRIYIKVFDANATTLAGLALITDNTLAVLSNGSPIVELSADTIVHLDGTESRTRASNLSISTYKFDDDKLNKVGAVQATDADGISDLMSGTFSTTGAKELSYSFSNISDSVNSDGRFYPTYRLTRLQVKDNMTNATYHNAEATITITDYTELNTGDKVNLIATDGTNYDFTVGDQSSVDGTWEAANSNDATATNLMNVINTSSGPSGTRFTATVSEAIVTATQATAGLAGSTTVTLTDSDTAGMTKTNFTVRASDTLTYSAIEHFDDTSYTAAAVEMPSDLESKGLLLYSNKDVAPADGVGLWADVSSRNSIDTNEIFGGSSTYQLRDSTNLTDHPKNHLFIAKTDKFDRIFFRMNNINVVAETNWPPSVTISAYYGNGTTWTPLEIIDETQGLQTSGSIKFTMPHDWYKGQYTHIDGGNWVGPVDEQGDTGTVAPGDLWTFNAYGLLICFTVKGTSDNETKLKCMNVWPYNNSHSQLIKIIDSHYVSLNSIAIAQSITFGRTSKTISVEDKFGKADIRKIGASGGKITFGGIDLGSTTDHRKTMVSYQKNGTPVFLDISHKSGDITRFFGVITMITEDHPAGLMIPKWGVTMQIGHILELGSDGLINSDKISIGGALVDDGQYIL